MKETIIISGKFGKSLNYLRLYVEGIGYVQVQPFSIGIDDGDVWYCVAAYVTENMSCPVYLDSDWFGFRYESSYQSITAAVRVMHKLADELRTFYPVPYSQRNKRKPVRISRRLPLASGGRHAWSDSRKVNLVASKKK